MSTSPLSLPYLFLFLLATLFHSSQADVGTAAHYSPPYLRKYILLFPALNWIYLKLVSGGSFPNNLSFWNMSLWLFYTLTRPNETSMRENNRVGFMCSVFVLSCSYILFWQWCVTVSVKQLVRICRRRNMGQWSSLWKAVLGEVHKRRCPENLHSGEDDSDQGCGSRTHFGVAAFEEWCYHGAFHNCICCHRQRFCFVC